MALRPNTSHLVPPSPLGKCLSSHAAANLHLESQGFILRLSLRLIGSFLP
jgi:hypothetical protein